MDDFLKNTIARLEARNGAPAGSQNPPDMAPRRGTGAAEKLLAEQIVSDHFAIAPTQLPFVVDNLTTAVADKLNMRMFAPRIKQIIETALPETLRAARKMGKK